MNRKRPKQIVIRLSEDEFIRVKNQVEKSELRQNEYLIRAILNKKITVVEGFEELKIELKRIGNNLNQLTRMAHEGRVNCADELSQINKELEEVWQLLKSLIRGQV